MLILEEMEHARRRGADIVAEVVGYGMSGDAFHITAPSENGDGAVRVMRNALADAGIRPEDITISPNGDLSGEVYIVESLGRENLIATQFHPERSGRIGLELLNNFCKWDGTC